MLFKCLSSQTLAIVQHKHGVYCVRFIKHVNKMHCTLNIITLDTMHRNSKLLLTLTLLMSRYTTVIHILFLKYYGFCDVILLITINIIYFRVEELSM